MSDHSPTPFGKYELLALLATGGMAEIWLARPLGATGFEKMLVVKRLLDEIANDQKYVQMFLDEARINARLQHANVVQVVELGQVDQKYFIAMEYVRGLSVAVVGKRSTQRLGEVPQAIACGIIAQSCAGLHYAHTKTLPDGSPLNIIHRDISPQNLILTWDGLIKVVDFGIAKAEDRSTETRAGFVKGKFSYMSPEQCLGQKLDKRSDIFALGIVLFELCTARRLFKRGKPYQTYEAITKADVPSPRSLNPKIHPTVEAVIMRALARNPDDRFRTAGEMQEALEYSMQKAGLKGARGDMDFYMNKTFRKEFLEQEELLAQVQRGDTTLKDAVQISALAERLAQEKQTATDPSFIGEPSSPGAPSPPQPLTGLGEESKPTQLPADVPPFDAPTTPHPEGKLSPEERAARMRARAASPFQFFLYFLLGLGLASVVLILLWLWHQRQP